jgi:hypothetical protein
MINESLTVLKDVVYTIAPTGQPTLTAAYSYPAQQLTMPDTIEAEMLPVAIIHRRTNRRTPLGSFAAGKGRHRWTANIDLLLLPGPLVSEEQIRAADALFEPWLVAMYGLLFQNLTLAGTADMIGGGVPGGDFFEYIDTHLQWFSKVYWGIRFELPVKQSWAQAMTTN